MPYKFAVESGTGALRRYDVFRVEVSTSNRWHASRSALSGVRARDSLFGSKAFAKHWNNHGKQRSLDSDYIALESQFVGESDPR